MNIFHPVGGIDYPRTLQEFDEWFPNEEECFKYIQRIRWPAGFICPTCKGNKGWSMTKGLIRCSKCRQDISIIAGTIFQGTRKPLRLWFQAMWYVTSQKIGGSALGLKRVLGHGSYQTAWSWLHKMRKAMVRPDRDQLKGIVEVDETFVGGEEKGGKRGRGAGRKSIVVIALEIYEPKGYGRVRMQRITSASEDNLIPFIRKVILPGSIVRTDSWSGYNKLEEIEYVHKKVNLSVSGDPAHIALPGVHRVSSLLKRWLTGTHQGAVRSKHLDYYLDEYTFRFNRRKANARGLLFYRLLQQSLESDPLTYKQIVNRD